jgi:thymidylate synthase
MLQGWDMVGRGIEIKPGYACATVWEYNGGYNNDVDKQYLDLVNEIIENGEVKDTRAGKTRSLFGKQLRFNLKEGLPMLTTKKMFSKGVIHELLWFLNGDTNIKYLVDNGVHIWDDDAYRYYLELNKYWRGPNGLEDVYDKETFLKMVKLGSFSEKILNQDKSKYHYGDLGPVYGAQWVKWGGVNQIKELIKTLKNNPDDRRMIISAWNVDEISNMALPPCHYCCQFYTKKMTEYERWKYFENNMLEEDDEEGNYNLSVFMDAKYIDGSLSSYLDRMNVPTRKLSCMWNQRSVDCGLGLGFNIMSYGLLTYMIAQCVNMDVDELIFNGGDVHVYENHIEQLKEQLKRNPYKYALPKLVLNQDKTEISDFVYDDIKIVGYKSYPTIKMPLSVGL